MDTPFFGLACVTSQSRTTAGAVDCLMCHHLDKLIIDWPSFMKKTYQQCTCPKPTGGQIMKLVKRQNGVTADSAIVHSTFKTICLFPAKHCGGTAEAQRRHSIDISKSNSKYCVFIVIQFEIPNIAQPYQKVLNRPKKIQSRHYSGRSTGG
jgi:hypothetical protein